MKKIIAIIGLTAMALYYFYGSTPDTDIFIDKIEVKNAAVKKVAPPLPLPVKKTVKKKEITKASVKKKLTGEILDLTSTSHSLKSIDYIIDDRLKQAQIYLPPQEYEKLEKVLKKHFDGEKIVQKISDHLAKNLSLEELEILKKRTEDPFLTKVWGLEEYANSSEGAQAFKEFLVASKKDPSPEERVALMKKFDDMVGGTDSVVELNSAIVRGILEGSNSTMPRDQKMSTREIKQMTVMLADQIKDNVDTKVVKNLLFTYQELSDGDIQDLIKRSSDGTFSKANDLIQEKLKEILLEGGREIGKSKLHLN
ncbi:MAG: hypothetical protein DRQ88_03815 [Epsilonproteobacteria bacterium]|nr:MAG: hypothetical protein DRQ89_04120 [Campylobacterota bacterium]RLA67165.1 MAG: hypothetical protein DRQ88_03815 [Campylobacterota bacterium]